jgi:hypothetical protein
MEEATAVLDTVLVFVKLGVPGKKLDELESSSGNIQQKWQSMIEIRLQTELHVINAFGFESSQHGMFAYRQTMAQLMQRAPAGALEELQSVMCCCHMFDVSPYILSQRFGRYCFR